MTSIELDFDPSKFRPVGDKVLVRHQRPPTMSPSGLLHLPMQAQKKTYEGEVIAVGSRMDDPVAPGDVVTWETFAGMESGKDQDGFKYLVLTESEIMAVIER